MAIVYLVIHKYIYLSKDFLLKSINVYISSAPTASTSGDDDPHKTLMAQMMSNFRSKVPQKKATPDEASPR